MLSGAIIDRTPQPARLIGSVLGVSVIIGLAVVWLMAFGTKKPLPAGEYFAGALIGLTIASLALGLDWLMWRLPGGNTGGAFAPIKMSLAFFFAGVLGLTFGNWLASLLGWTGFSLAENLDPSRILFFGGFSVGVGLVFFTIESLKARLRRSVEQLKDQEFAEKELATARALQKRLLPPGELRGDGYLVLSRNEPARYVAGDFYDVFPLPDGSLGFAVGDVSGKGMAASLIMATVKAMLQLVAVDRTVAETLGELNRRLVRDLTKREFVALCFGRYDPQTGMVEVGNAGLPDPYHAEQTNGSGWQIVTVDVPGARLPLGLRADTEYQSTVVQLNPGDRLVLVSDGLPEAPVNPSEPLGYEKFEELLRDELMSSAAASVADDGGRYWVDSLIGSLEDMSSAGRDDDWTLLSLEKLPLR